MGDTACKLKVILDGGNAYRLLESMCETASAADSSLFTDENSYPLIEKLIKLEKQATECQDMLLDIIGYNGPRPPFFKHKYSETSPSTTAETDNSSIVP
jgi:hypothetical protein